MNKFDIRCTGCHEYREYCKCAKETISLVRDKYQEKLDGLDKKLDRIIELLEGHSSSINKVEL